MAKNVLMWMLAPFVSVCVILIDNYRTADLEKRISDLEKKVNPMYTAFQQFEAQRLAARRQLQGEVGSAVKGLEDLSKDYGKPPHWKE